MSKLNGPEERDPRLSHDPQQPVQSSFEKTRTPVPPDADNATLGDAGSVAAGDSGSTDSNVAKRPDGTPVGVDSSMSHQRHAVRDSAMELIRFLVPLGVLLVGIAGMLYLKSLKEPPVAKEPESVVPMVQTVEVEANTSGLDISTDGVVVPYRNIKISSQISGRIEFKAPVCRAGNYVTAGTLLMTIDKRDYELEVERLEKELAQAENGIKELDIGLENTKKVIELAEEELRLQQAERDRIKQLYDKKYMSDTEYDAARRATVVAETTLTKLNNDITMQEATRTRIESVRDRVVVQLARAKLDLSRTDIYSPVDGIVTDDPVEQDWFVNMGTPLVTIEDTSRVEVKCNLTTDELYWLWMQQAENTGVGNEAVAKDSPVIDYSVPQVPVTVGYEVGGQKYLWDGKLARYDGLGIDQATRTMPCRIVVEQPRQMRVETNGQSTQKQLAGPPALVRGMFVTVNIHAQPDTQLLRVPNQAVRPGGELLCVRDGKLSIVGVKVIESENGQTIIRAEDGSLVPGDRIVATPLAYAEEGMAVQDESVNASAESEAPKNPEPSKTPVPSSNVSPETKPASATTPQGQLTVNS